MKNQLALLLLLISFTACSQTTTTSYKNIDQKIFAEMMTGKDVVILDVRTPGEYGQGHIPSALLIDYTNPDFAANVEALDKNKTYLVYCASGKRSSNASALMTKNGFKEIYNLEGGFNGWDGAKEK